MTAPSMLTSKGNDVIASPVLQLQKITKQFGSLLANDAISLNAYAGEIIALLGENGAGKTTLMNVLFGHYRADGGDIKVFGQNLFRHSPEEALARGVGMVHQHFTLADNLSVLDNILLGTESLWQPFSRRKTALAKLRDIMVKSGLIVDANALVKDLTVGERQRVEILKALYRDVRILILDEPTAVLTPQEVDDLFLLLRKMAKNGLAIIIISHKLQEVLAISDRVVVLRQGKVAGEAQTENVDREKLAAMIVGREVERPQIQGRKAGKQMLVLSNICVDEDARNKAVLQQINLTLHSHQILGVAGVSGNGQSTLADILSGMRAPTSGQFSIHGKQLKQPTPTELTALGLARIPEDRHKHGVVSELSIWENLLLDELGTSNSWRWGHWLDREHARQHAQLLIDQFDVRCKGTDQPAGLLSGGNMQKLILSRNLSRNPVIILANQPTRGLDEGAIASVHRLLISAREQGAGIILISEDLDELLRLSDDIAVMHDGHLIEAVPTDQLSIEDLGMRMSGAA